MKKSNTIRISLVLAFLIASSVFLIKFYGAQNTHRAATEVAQKQEVETSLNSLDVSPVVESSESGSTQKEDGEKSEYDVRKREKNLILTFSNIRQCGDLKYLKSECKDYFLYALAKKNNNENACSEISDPVTKRDCLDEVNNKKWNCSTITNAYLKSKCDYSLERKNKIEQKEGILSSAMKNGDKNLCAKLPDYPSKESCIKHFILKDKDISLCDKAFESTTDRDKCRKNVSYDLNRSIMSEVSEKQDISLCAKILDENIRNQCKSMRF